jgi:hypothetical protein
MNNALQKPDPLPASDQSLSSLYWVATCLTTTEVVLRLYWDEPSANGSAHLKSCPWKVTGYLTGPYHRFHRTVASVYPLRPCDMLETGRRVVAEVLIPEPCFWSPEQPYLYHARLTCQAISKTELPSRVATWRIAFRHLHATGGSFFLTGKPWQPVGFWDPRPFDHQASPPETLVQRLRSAGLNLWVGRVTAELAVQAATSGLALWHVCHPSIEESALEVRRLRREPAVLAWLALQEHATPQLLQLLKSLDPVRPIGIVLTEPSLVRAELAASARFVLAPGHPLPEAATRLSPLPWVSIAEEFVDPHVHRLQQLRKRYATSAGVLFQLS